MKLNEKINRINELKSDPMIAKALKKIEVKDLNNLFSRVSLILVKNGFLAAALYQARAYVAIRLKS